MGLPIPTNLDECINLLTIETSQKDLNNFKETDETQATTVIHHNIGRSLRNKWGLWQKNVLTKYFNVLGITHADDMSDIIFTSLHRTLNDKPVEVAEQVAFYINYWKDIEKDDS